MKSLKKVLCAVLTTVLLMLAVPAMASEDITVTIDGQQIAFDVPPQIINNRTMVPLRTIFEALGATVDWNGETKTVTSTKGGTTVSLTIDNPVLYVNGNGVTLDTPACIVNNRTLVPVRAISEAFKADVKWDVGNKAVLITTTNNTNSEDNQSSNNTSSKDNQSSNNTNNQTTNYSSAYQKLVSQLDAKGGYIFDDNVSIMHIIPNENASYVGFSYTFDDGTEINLFIDDSGSIIVGYDEYKFSGYYESSQITVRTSIDSSLNDAIIQLINNTYSIFDVIMIINGIDVEISDFGIAY